MERSKFMMLSDKVYSCLKWIALIFLPALAVLASAIMPLYGLGAYTETVVITINAVAVFIGTLIGVSQISYNKGDRLDG